MVTSNRPKDDYEDYATWISEWCSSARHLRANKLTFAPSDTEASINTEDFIHTVNAVLSIYDRSDHKDLWQPGTLGFIAAPVADTNADGSATLAMAGCISTTMGPYQINRTVADSIDGLKMRGREDPEIIASFQWLALAQPVEPWHPSIHELLITVVNPLAYAVMLRIAHTDDAGWHCPSFEPGYPTLAHVMYHQMYTPVFKHDPEFYDQWNKIFTR